MSSRAAQPSSVTREARGTPSSPSQDSARRAVTKKIPEGEILEGPVLPGYVLASLAHNFTKPYTYDYYRILRALGTVPQVLEPKVAHSIGH